MTQSIEAEVYTPEELAMFWDLAEQYAEHKNAVKADPSDKIDQRELASVRAEIVALFGPEIWFFDEEERAYLSRYQ